jgi:hypothetical protein
MMIMSQTKFVVIYESGDGKTFIRPANGIWGIKAALDGIVDFTVVRLTDGGYVTKCGGRVNIVGEGREQMVASLRRGIGRPVYC